MFTVQLNKTTKACRHANIWLRLTFDIDNMIKTFQIHLVVWDNHRISCVPLLKFSYPVYLWFRSSSMATAQTVASEQCSSHHLVVPKENNFGILQPLEHMLLRNCVLVKGQTLNDNLQYQKLCNHFIWRVWYETHLKLTWINISANSFGIFKM